MSITRVEKENILCSVVMPVHNGELFLREAIESVLNQTYKNFEFLIIENCSTDSSVEIIKSYNDSRIRLIIEEDCGIVQAYNRGFRDAKGEYILVHDHDDISYHRRLELLLHYSVSHELDICGSSFNIINDKGIEVKKIYPPINKDEIINKILFDFFSLFNPTLIIKKSILKELNYFDTSVPIGTDYDFVLRSLKKFKHGNFSEFLLKYRVHKNSTSRKNWEIGNSTAEKMSFKYYEQLKYLFDDKDFILGRMYYYFEKYFQASKYLLLSILKKGISLEKAKYLIISSVFVLPLSYARKNNLFFNKHFNYLINIVSKRKIL